MKQWIQKKQLDFDRVLDHTYRKIRGVPRLERSQITPHMYLGGQYYRLGLKHFKKWGITGVISMRTTPPLGFTKVSWLEVLHLPTLDQQAPSVEQFKAGIEFIHTHLQKGGAVYIHCRYGEGRGPTMAIAYLMSTGMPYQKALDEVIRIRPFIRPTNVQKEQLLRLEAILLTNFSQDSHTTMR